MFDQHTEHRQITTDADIRKMAVEIVMFDEEDQPEHRSSISLADYLGPLISPVFQRVAGQG